MKICVVSGGFDPVHSGHIEYINASKSFGDYLVVCLNSDEWLIKKKGKAFLPFHERKKVLENFKNVDLVLGFEDDNLGSCKNGLIEVRNRFPSSQIIFCNGGDRTNDNIPEMDLEFVEFEFSVGGDIKLNSSSDILKNWVFSNEKRVWGEFNNLFSDDFVKVKELVVLPNSGMSFQRHHFREELWLVSKGRSEVYYSVEDESSKSKVSLKQGDFFKVDLKAWHQITNPYDEICKIIEIQFGEKCIEDDIERLYYYKDI